MTFADDFTLPLLTSVIELTRIFEDGALVLRDIFPNFQS